MYGSAGLLLLLLLAGLDDFAFAQYRSCSQGTTCLPLNQCRKIYHDVYVLKNFSAAQKRLCGRNKQFALVCCTEQERNNVGNSRINGDSGGDNGSNGSNGSNGNNGNNGNNAGSFVGSSLLPKQCGENIGVERIIGGQTVSLKEFPWMVMLEYRTPTGVRPACGGALINNRYVLSAGHCVLSKFLGDGWSLVSVRLGELNTNTDPDCEPDEDGQMVCAPRSYSVRIEKTIVNEAFQGGNSQQGDLALLRLERPIAFSESVRPICLPESDTLTSMFTVAGWGMTEYAKSATVMLKVDVPRVNWSTCAVRYNIRGQQREMAQSHICAGGQKGKDSCEGDSGGPLMMTAARAARGENPRHYAVGVTSFGYPSCGKEGWPAVYTSVYHFRSWIINNLRP